MEVYPIQFTAVDWNSYIKLCQEHLGFSPTRGLDENNIDPKKPSSFLYTLDLGNQPRKAIKDKNLYTHCFASILAVIDSNDYYKMFFCSLPFTWISSSINNKVIVVVSANIAQWDYAIITFMNESMRKPTLIFLNKVKRVLEQAGYNELWSNYEEFHQADGTFTLKCR